MRWPDLAGLVVSLVVLVASLYYGYVGALLRPDIGFSANQRTGTITSVAAPCAPNEECPRLGDRIIAIRGVPFSTFAEDRTLVLYDPLRQVPKTIPVTVERNGRVLTVSTTPTTRSYGTPLVNLSAIVIPLAFWLVGILAILLLRPRDERWLVFVAWSFLTAIWFATGFASETHLGYSSVVFHVAIWLWIGVMLHLHLVLPEKMMAPGLLLTVLVVIYAGVFGAMGLDLARVIPNSSYVIPTLAAILASFGLLAGRVLRARPPALRRASRLMAFGVAMGCGPVILFGLLPLLVAPMEWTHSIGAQALIALLAILAIPLWPLSYLHALHRPDLRAFQFRGNRLLGTYGFLALMVFSYLTFLYAMAVVFRRAGAADGAELERRLLMITVLSSVIVVAAAAPLRGAFQGWVDRRIFGIQYSSQQVVETMAEKLPGGFDGHRLQNILEQDLLPTLMIRESALYLFGDGQPRPFLTMRVPSGQEPDERTLEALTGLSCRYLPRGKNHPGPHWVRLAIPLELEGETLGLWLFGTRDPDDFYSRSDVDLLRKLSNQVAVVLRSQREIAERRALQEQLLEVQKMEALGRLAAGVAHDFNNLLSVMLVATEMARETTEPEGETRGLLDEVAIACDRASKLTKQLLIFSRRQTFDLQTVSLNASIEDNLPILRSIVGGTVELELSLEEDLPYVEADPAQVEQVLFNLTINAVDAMPRGGRVEILTSRVTVTEEDGEDLRTPPPGDYVRLSVQDTGEGIEPDVITHVFEPFFTTKRARGGTGLGLSLVYGIVQQSGGHTFVHSEPGEGARFDLYLPVSRQPVPEESPPEEPRERSADRATGLRVLVAEDEANILTLVSRMLRTWGYEVLEAHDGVEALKLFREAEPAIDVLLTDLVMPEMGGNELAKAILGDHPDVPVIYMSGFALEDTLGKEAEGAVLLAKPFTAEQLRRSLRIALEADGPGNDLASGDDVAG